MNHTSPAALRCFSAPDTARFQIQNGHLHCVDPGELLPNQVSLIRQQLDPSSKLPFSGLVAAYPINRQQYLFAEIDSHDKSKPATIRCRCVPTDRIEAVLMSVIDAKQSPEVAPSLENLDRVEPVLRCATSGQTIVACGCDVESTMLAAWRLLPPSCRHELTFNAPPFRQHRTSVVFADSFDTRLVGPQGADVILDLSNREPANCLQDLTLSWPVALHFHLLHERPVQAVEQFFRNFCESARLTELEDIAFQWCERSELQSEIFVSTSLEDSAGLVDHSIVEQLGQLDDAVFDAIAGASDALSRMRKLWPAAKSDIPEHLIEESREHYMRYVVNEWTQRIGEQRDPSSCLPTIEVMRILLDE